MNVQSAAISIRTNTTLELLTDDERTISSDLNPDKHNAGTLTDDERTISSDLNPDKHNAGTLTDDERTISSDFSPDEHNTGTLTDDEHAEFQCCVCLDLNRCWLASTVGRCCLNSEQCIKIRTLPHGCTNFGHFVARATKYFTGKPNIYCGCVFTSKKEKNVSFHKHLAERSRRQWSSQVTPKLRVLCMELCFILPFCAQGIVGGTKRFVKFVGPWSSLYVTPLRT